MTVTFCGHSQLSDQDNLASWLNFILPSLIEGGATTFYLGGYGAFDRLAAAAVKRQKTAYPTIEAILVLPYLDRKVDDSDYDRTTYPPLEKVPPRFAIVKRNQWRVERADVVISAVTYRQGGAAKTLSYAARKGKVILQYPIQTAEKQSEKLAKEIFIMTFEKVLNIFEDYLKEDTCAEAVLTRWGYAVMIWDTRGQHWSEVIAYPTPEKLFDALLEKSEEYWSYQLSKQQGIEEYTPEIKAAVKEKCRIFLEKRREAERE